MQISILGKSLGGATGIHLAAANPGRIQTLVVENTFASIEDVAYKVQLPPPFAIPDTQSPRMILYLFFGRLSASSRV